MPFDVASVRSHFPSLTEGAAPASTAPVAARHPTWSGRGRRRHPDQRDLQPGLRHCVGAPRQQVVTDARAALADLLGADPRGIVFGRSATALTYDLARALAKDWGPGDEVVVTRLDHDANIRPWVQAAQAAGATVRWVDFDPGTGELSADAVACRGHRAHQARGHDRGPPT